MLNQERLERFLREVSETYINYNDPEMNEGRIRLYQKWLSEIKTSMMGLSERLNDEELSALLDAAEDLFPRKWFPLGTSYGTCYGARPVLEMLRYLKEEDRYIGDEGIRAAYISAMHKIYDRFQPNIADPFYFFTDGDNDKKKSDMVGHLNDKIRKTESGKRLEAIQEWGMKEPKKLMLNFT